MASTRKGKKRKLSDTDIDVSTESSDIHASSSSSTSTNQFDKPLAFVVNIPLKLELKNDGMPDYQATVAIMNNVRTAYLSAYSEADCPPFRIIFCVNTMSKNKKSLDQFETQLRDKNRGRAASSSTSKPAEDYIKTRDYDVHFFDWQESTNHTIPYGAIRNSLLHSRATQHAIESFQEKYYPYIAIGDADTGRRTTIEANGKEKHIFKAIADRLTLEFDETGPVIHARPYIMAGGYRVKGYQPKFEEKTHPIEKSPVPISAAQSEGSASPSSAPVNLNQQTHSMHHSATVATSNTSASEEKQPAKKSVSLSSDFSTANPMLLASAANLKPQARPRKNAGVASAAIDADAEEKRPEGPKAKIKHMGESVDDDMFVRMMNAIYNNELGPYYPEPNLFIDASIAREVRFGNIGAEFSHLRNEVSKLIYRKTNEQLVNSENSDVDTAICIENNRDDNRHKLVMSFFDLTIETDVERLFKKFLKTEGDVDSDDDEELSMMSDGPYSHNRVGQHHRKSRATSDMFVGDAHLKPNLSDKKSRNLFTTLVRFISDNEQRLVTFISGKEERKDFNLFLCEMEAEIINQLRQQKNNDVAPVYHTKYPELIEPIKEILSLCKDLSTIPGKTQKKPGARLSSKKSKDKSKTKSSPEINIVAKELRNNDYLPLLVWNSAVITALMRDKFKDLKNFKSTLVSKLDPNVANLYLAEQRLSGGELSIIIDARLSEVTQNWGSITQSKSHTADYAPVFDSLSRLKSILDASWSDVMVQQAFPGESVSFNTVDSSKLQRIEYKILKSLEEYEKISQLVTEHQEKYRISANANPSVVERHESIPQMSATPVSTLALASKQSEKEEKIDTQRSQQLRQSSAVILSPNEKHRIKNRLLACQNLLTKIYDGALTKAKSGRSEMCDYVLLKAKHLQKLIRNAEPTESNFKLWDTLINSFNQFAETVIKDAPSLASTSSHHRSPK
jgi:hypothetical protein